MKHGNARARFPPVRYPLASLCVLCAVAAQALSQASAPKQAQAAKRKIPCKTPEIASSCYWARGRLSFYQGNPAFRIWKVGTKRILGVYSGPNSERYDPLDNEHPEFPTSLGSVYEAEYKRRVKKSAPLVEWPDPVFAEFEICPLEPQRKGEMQSVCIESVKNVFVQRVERGSQRTGR